MAPSSSSASCEMRPQDFSYLQSLPGNMECIDCGSTKPDWGSPKLGILFCFQCSGRHRGLGTHISFVRSVTLDAWTAKQVDQMKLGGNTQCKEFLSQRGIDMAHGTPLSEKYDTPEAELYRQVLSARVEGRPEPTTLPQQTARKAKSKTSATTSANTTTGGTPRVDPRRLQGFGNSPPPRQQHGPTKIAIAAGGVVVVGAAVWLVVKSIF